MLGPGRYPSPCGNKVSLPRCELARAGGGQRILRQRLLRVALPVPQTHGLTGCRMLGPRSLPGPEKTHVLLWLRCKRAPKAAVWCEATSLLLPGRERARCGQQRAAGLALRAQALPREQLRHGAVKELQIPAQPPRWPVDPPGALVSVWGLPCLAPSRSTGLRNLLEAKALFSPDVFGY